MNAWLGSLVFEGLGFRVLWVGDVQAVVFAASQQYLRSLAYLVRVARVNEYKEKRMQTYCAHAHACTHTHTNIHTCVDR